MTLPGPENFILDFPDFSWFFMIVQTLHSAFDYGSSCKTLRVGVL